MLEARYFSFYRWLDYDPRGPKPVIVETMPSVNPEILKWARETAGLSTEEAAAKLPSPTRAV